MTTTTEAAAPTLTSILVTGIVGTVVVLIIAALCIAPFEHHYFAGWVALAFMAATPSQVILGLLWHSSKPDFVGALAQPIKGVALTLITICMGALVMGLMLLFVSGGHGITPMLSHYAIMTIVMIIWVVTIWQCWPVTLLTKNPMIIGIGALIYSYLLAYIVWWLFFDYGMLAKIGDPHYYQDIDPAGFLDMSFAITYFVTVAGLIIVHMLFDFWPVDKLAGKTKQPLRGIIGSVYMLVFAWVLRYFCVEVLGMEQVDYMVRIPVCMIFGTFLINNMMQFSLFPKLAQPVRGLALTACAIVLAIVMHEVYAFASTLHAGEALGTGPMAGYAREFWIASAMLGVTFPVIFAVSGFFAFWPIRRD